MKNRSKIGNQKGNPAYRTPAMFRERQFVKVSKLLRRGGFKKIEKSDFHHI